MSCVCLQDLNRLPMQWQISHDVLRVVTQTTRLLQLAEKHLNAASPWKAEVLGLLAEQCPEQAADAAHLGRALCHLQVLQALLTDHHVLLNRRLVQVGDSGTTASPKHQALVDVA